MLLWGGNSKPLAGIISFPRGEQHILAGCHQSLIEAQPSQTATGANALSPMGTSKLESVQGLHLTNCELQIAEERVLGM